MLQPLYRHLLAFAFMVCLLTAAQAQQAQRIGLSVGVAAPIGEFKKDRFEDDYPPFARRGANWQLFYRSDLKPYLGVGATAGYRSHRFDLDTFAAPDDALVLQREASDWRSTYALADLYLQSAPHHLFGYIKGSLGAAHNKSPEVLVDTRYGPIYRSSDTAVALAYGIAGGFGVQNGRFLFTIDIGLLSTRPSFEIRNAQGERTTLVQSMQTVNSMVGLSYTL